MNSAHFLLLLGFMVLTSERAWGQQCQCWHSDPNSDFPIVANGTLFPSQWKDEQFHTPTVRQLADFYRKIQRSNFTYFNSNISLLPSSQGSWNSLDSVLVALIQVNTEDPSHCLRMMAYDHFANLQFNSETRASLLHLFSKPYVCGFFVDEPTQPNLVHAQRWISYLSAGQDSSVRPYFYVNLFGARAEIVHDYMKYVEEWVRLDSPSVLSYDNYPVWDDSLAAEKGDGIGLDWQFEYFWNLEFFRQLSLRQKAVFWTWLLVHAHHSSYAHSYYRRSAEADLRLQVYAAVAYGARGLLYYNFWNPWFVSKGAWSEQIGLLDYDFRKTPLYESAAEVNGEIRKLGPLLVRLESIGVYHAAVTHAERSFKSHVDRTENIAGTEPTFSKRGSDYFAYGIKLVSWNDTSSLHPADLKNKFVHSLDNKNSFVGLFRDPRNMDRYALVVNKNRKSDEQVTVTLDIRMFQHARQLKGLMLEDMLDGKRTRCVLIAGQLWQATLLIGPGSGRLVRVVPQQL